MKTKFENFKLNEINNNNKNDIILYFKDQIETLVRNYIQTNYTDDELENYDIQNFYESDEMISLYDDASKKFYEAIDENLEKYNFSSYEYQKEFLEREPENCKELDETFHSCL